MNYKNFYKHFLLAVFAFSCLSGNSQDVYSVISLLRNTIENKGKFDRKKEERINKLKIKHNDPADQYLQNEILYREYKKFKIDSAIYYVKENIETVQQKNLNPAKMYRSQLQLAALYSSSGLYRESEKILKSIDRKDLQAYDLLPLYYEAYREFFEHYGTNDYATYGRQIEAYRDSLLMTLNPTGIKYKINRAQANIYQGKKQEATKQLKELLSNIDENSEDYPMAAYLLGDIYEKDGNLEQAKIYYGISSISDIKNAIKDNASIQVLAVIFFNEGEINKAYRYAQSAIEDAIFCNVQFRTIQMSEFYKIINMAYLEKEANRKSQLQLYLLLISILSLFLIAAIVYVWKQMKKVSYIREELSETNKKLLRLNEEMQRTNSQLEERNIQLSESNHIKEEYIAHFFDLCSAYITKLENYRKSLNKKALNKQLDELFGMLKSTTIEDNELEELYRNFDNIFLNLYPTFVEDFNTLLLPDEQIALKPGELLNTELRVFALVRLGITDSVKIAAFLRYSLSTIYNYRTKARNKAAVSRDEFEKMVMKIGSLSKG